MGTRSLLYTSPIHCVTLAMNQTLFLIETAQVSHLWALSAQQPGSVVATGGSISHSTADTERGSHGHDSSTITWKLCS